MKSQQAQNLLTITRHCRTFIDGAPAPVERIARILAAQIIAGSYPKLRNVFEEDDGEEVIAAEEDHRQPDPEFGQGVCEYVAWFSDGEDSRYEIN